MERRMLARHSAVKPRADLAESLIFYQAKDAISAMRSAFGYAGEGFLQVYARASRFIGWRESRR